MEGGGGIGSVVKRRLVNFQQRPTKKRNENEKEKWPQVIATESMGIRKRNAIF